MNHTSEEGGASHSKGQNQVILYSPIFGLPYTFPHTISTAGIWFEEEDIVPRLNKIIREKFFGIPEWFPFVDEQGTAYNRWQIDFLIYAEKESSPCRLASPLLARVASPLLARLASPRPCRLTSPSPSRLASPLLARPMTSSLLLTRLASPLLSSPRPCRLSSPRPCRLTRAAHVDGEQPIVMFMMINII
ncbi:hypothetical protein ACLB2K_007039 [Fragaria x ananassa]